MPVYDLGSLAHEELGEVGVHDAFIVILPLPSIGHTNEHIDICSDLIDAAWVAERLAAYADMAEAAEEYVRQTHSTQINLKLSGVRPDITAAMADGILVFQGIDDDRVEAQDRYQQLRNDIADFEDNVHNVPSRFPAIIDSYYANLVGGGYFFYRSEAPAHYAEEMRRFPERRLGFFRSAFSDKVGSAIFASNESWLTPRSLSPNEFFQATQQPYKLADFVVGRIFSVGGKSFVASGDELLWFPMRQYFKSRVCESLSLGSQEDDFGDSFDWWDATFTVSPFHKHHRQPLDGGVLRQEPAAEDCLVDKSGSLVIVCDGSHRHYLYDTSFLGDADRRTVFDSLSDLSQFIGSSLSASVHARCDWAALNDDQFEELCYDLVYENPRFDPNTIRRMGKSRSRDGGRDIIVDEAQHFPISKRRRWIFQCKLIRDGSSLTATKLRDVGDMLDQYGAGGFGVFTSAPIDATLYDKLDAICSKRDIEQLHHSVHELERRLTRYEGIKKKYFGNPEVAG